MLDLFPIACIINAALIIVALYWLKTALRVLRMHQSYQLANTYTANSQQIVYINKRVNTNRIQGSYCQLIKLLFKHYTLAALWLYKPNRVMLMLITAIFGIYAFCMQDINLFQCSNVYSFSCLNWLPSLFFGPAVALGVFCLEIMFNRCKQSADRQQKLGHELFVWRVKKSMYIVSSLTCCCIFLVMCGLTYRNYQNKKLQKYLLYLLIAVTAQNLLIKPIFIVFLSLLVSSSQSVVNLVLSNHPHTIKKLSSSNKSRVLSYNNRIAPVQNTYKDTSINNRNNGRVANVTKQQMQSKNTLITELQVQPIPCLLDTFVQLEPSLPNNSKTTKNQYNMELQPSLINNKPAKLSDGFSNRYRKKLIKRNKQTNYYLSDQQKQTAKDSPNTRMIDYSNLIAIQQPAKSRTGNQKRYQTTQGRSVRMVMRGALKQRFAPNTEFLKISDQIKQCLQLDEIKISTLQKYSEKKKYQQNCPIQLQLKRITVQPQSNNIDTQSYSRKTNAQFNFRKVARQSANRNTLQTYVHVCAVSEGEGENKRTSFNMPVTKKQFDRSQFIYKSVGNSCSRERQRPIFHQLTPIIATDYYKGSTTTSQFFLPQQ